MISLGRGHERVVSPCLNASERYLFSVDMLSLLLANVAEFTIKYMLNISIEKDIAVYIYI